MFFVVRAAAVVSFSVWPEGFRNLDCRVLGFSVWLVDAGALGFAGGTQTERGILYMGVSKHPGP